MTAHTDGGDAARAAVAAALGGSSWPLEIPLGDLVASARDERVHLLLARQLSLPGLLDELRAAAVLEAAREAELRRVLDALGAAGIRAVVIKGAALAYTHYSRPELRPRTDTDLLIPDSARSRTAGVLEALGYQQPTETAGEMSVSQFHFQRAQGCALQHALDVHWRISNVLAFAHVLSYDEIARDSMPLPALGAYARGPSTVHSLLLACVHRVAHHGESQELLWLYDIHLLTEALDPAGWSQATALAATRGVRTVCAASLRSTAAAFGGVAGRMATALAPPGGTTEATAAFLDLSDRPIDLLGADLRALSGWSERWQLAREHIFPAREYMFARYGTRRLLWLPWLYLQRIVLGAPKWFGR